MPVAVVIKDAAGNPINNFPVTFMVPVQTGASASFANAMVYTNASGAASATPTANSIPGAYSITATAGPVTFTFNMTNTAPDLTVSVTHAASHFSQGQTDAVYTIRAYNSGTTSTNGTPSP